MEKKGANTAKAREGGGGAKITSCKQRKSNFGNVRWRIHFVAPESIPTYVYSDYTILRTGMIYR